MAGAALLAVAGLLAGAALLLPPGKSLAVLLGTITLVPSALPIPAGSAFISVHRVVLIAALAGLLWRCFSREVSWDVFRAPPLVARFLVVLGILAVVGVGLAQPTTDLAAAARAWTSFALQLVTFVVVLALVRATRRPGAGVVALVVAVVIGAVIAAVEHVTGGSYARLWFHGVPELLGSDFAQTLGHRGGDVRVRVAGDFTLAYAFATAAVVPLVVVAAVLTRGRRRAALLASLPLVLLAVGWTYSRSVAAPALAGLLVVVVASRDRVVQQAAALLLGLGSVVVLATPALQRNFTLSVDQGSIDVRLNRLPAVTELVAQHPYRGVGLSGLNALGIPGTDSTFLLGYAEVGMIGLAALVGLVVAACAVAFRGVMSDDPAYQLLALGPALGAVIILVGSLSFDAFTTSGTAELFWVLIAFSVAAAERAPSKRWQPRKLRWAPRVGAVLGLVVIGFAMRFLAPTHIAQSFQFDALQPAAATEAAPTFIGVQLRTTMCDAIEADVRGEKTVRTNCRAFGEGPGQGILRLQASNRAELLDLERRVGQLVHSLPTMEYTRFRAMGQPERGTSAVARTAPAWLPLLGTLLLLPTPRLRRISA